MDRSLDETTAQIIVSMNRSSKRPRSRSLRLCAIHYCLLAARDSLHGISGTPFGTFRHPPEKLLGQLCSDLSFTSVDEIIERGLHQYLDELQTKMNFVGVGIYETFFAFKTPMATRKPKMSQQQTQ